jgi:hypothetical protein
MKMETGQIKMIYGNPFKEEYPIGEARLINKTDCSTPKIEQWQVAFLDEPEITRVVLIKKENEYTNK